MCLHHAQILFIGINNVWAAPMNVFNFDLLKASGSSTCIAPISQVARMGLGTLLSAGLR